MSREYSAEELFNIALGFAIIKNHEMAINFFNEVIKLEPNNKEAWYNKGKAFELDGNIDEAIDCYEKVLDIKPNYLQAMKEIGLLYYQKQQNYKASFWLKKYG
jgi:tetratricopeptide (TPR) repeat protein